MSSWKTEYVGTQIAVTVRWTDPKQSQQYDYAAYIIKEESDGV